MIVQAIAGGLGTAIGTVMPFQAVKYPDRVSSVWPPLKTIGMLGQREVHIVVVFVRARLLPGAELENILLLLIVCL